MHTYFDRFHLLFFPLIVGGLFGACDLDKPIGQLGDDDYKPCESKACGDACTVCEPGDPDCIESQIVKACDAQGQCVAQTPDLCEPAPVYEPCAGKDTCDFCTICDPDDLDCIETKSIKVCDESSQCTAQIPAICEEPAPYEPCAGKSCGDACTICDPQDLDCVEDLVLKVCDPDNQCVIGTPDICEEPAPYDPCAGKAECDECFLCPPNDPDCAEDAVIKVCDATLTCVVLSDDVCQPPPDYNACEGKVCGDACTICDPNDPDCFETQELKACDNKGQCVSDVPDLCL